MSALRPQLPVGIRRQGLAAAVAVVLGAGVGAEAEAVFRSSLWCSQELCQGVCAYQKAEAAEEQQVR